jgi:ribosomal protein S18 acetylase RimI-like enzyme
MGTARKLYERLGFRQVRELDTIYGKRSWLYRLDLK